MEFWVLWFIGIVITIGTRIAINKLTSCPYYYGKYHSCEENPYCSRYYYIESNSKRTQIIIYVFVIICIILVGGIANGKWLGFSSLEYFLEFGEYLDIWEYIIAGIIPCIITYIVIYFVLGLYHFKYDISNMIFIVVLIISIIGWTIPICNYNWNIERVTETTITSMQERKLLYFCNIPVQEVSGKISGSSILGGGSISGSISTSDELPYWYANENNEGEYDSVEASSSKIVFITDEENPYLEIITYRTYTKTINHNNGREDTETDKVWEEYIFYLPEAIMQYSLE